MHGKVILKEILANKIDYDFAYRPKKGFSVPLSKWFGKKSQQVSERLTDSRQMNSFFNKELIQAILDEGFSNRVWLLLFLDEWLEQFNSGK